MLLSTIKGGTMDDSARRNSLALRGLSPGVKARVAFTLIELLVVIAIIAILAAILMPVLDKAKQRAVTAECLNNMKQLQLAYRMYIDDNDDSLPLNIVGGASSWITNNNDQTTVLVDGIRNGVLYQYNQSVAIYECPGNMRQIPTPSGEVLQARKEYSNAGIVSGTPMPQTRTCSVNYPLGGSTNSTAKVGTGVYSVNKFTQMTAPNPTPAEMIGFCDENKYSVDDGDFAMYPAGSGQNEWWNMPGARHNNGTTWSFCDGHCEYWKWHGTVVPFSENNPNYTPYTPADTSDDLSRVQACTCPLPQ